MFGIGAGELMIAAIVMLIAVGPGKMPGLMKAVGKGLREFRRASSELRKQSGIDELMREDVLGVRALEREIKAPAPRREQTMTSEDLLREQPAEGVDIAHARARAVELAARTQTDEDVGVATTMVAVAREDGEDA